MFKKTLRICDAEIHEGESANLALPLPQLYTCASMHMPIKVINGREDGPCLLVFAAVTGVELNGVEIVNRLLKDPDLKNLKGSLIAVPVLNVYGMINYPQKLPVGNNITECFPGVADGTYGERIAHIFTKELLSKADYCVELQTGGVSYDILPQVYCNFDNLKTKSLAKVFGAPVITGVKLENNHLRLTTEDLNIPLLVYEAGEAMRFSESAIQLGLTGIKNVMAKVGMIEPTHDEHASSNAVFAQEDDWLRAHKGGVLRTDVTLGQHIAKNDKIGSISDPFSGDLSEPIHSTYDGIVVGINEAPLIHEGQSIFKIASFIDNEKAYEVIDNWEEPGVE